MRRKPVQIMSRSYGKTHFIVQCPACSKPYMFYPMWNSYQNHCPVCIAAKVPATFTRPERIDDEGIPKDRGRPKKGGDENSYVDPNAN